MREGDNLSTIGLTVSFVALIVVVAWLGYSFAMAEAAKCLQYREWCAVQHPHIHETLYAEDGK